MDSDTDSVRSSRQLSGLERVPRAAEHRRWSMSQEAHSSSRKCRLDGGGRHSPVFTLTESRIGVTFTGNMEDSILLVKAGRDAISGARNGMKYAGIPAMSPQLPELWFVSPTGSPVTV